MATISVKIRLVTVEYKKVIKP